MKAWSRLLRLELRIFSAEPSNWIVVWLMLLAALAAITNGAHLIPSGRRISSDAANAQAKQHNTVLKAIQAEERQRSAKGDTGPTISWTVPLAVAVRNEIYNFEAVLPPGPLSATSFGHSDLLPQSFALVKYTDDRPSVDVGDGRVLSNVTPERKTESPLRVWLGKWDLAFVVVYLYPLFVVALCLDFITADRANGTLALTLAQGVSSRSLATARLTIRALALLLAGVVLPAIGIVVAHAVAGQPADVGRLLLWLMAVSGYLAVWISACLILNARSRSAIANGLTMVTIWAVVTAILPAAVGLVARSVATVPSRILLANSERIERFAANEKMNQAFKDLIASFDAKYPRGPNPEIVRNRFRFVGLLSRPEGNPVLQAFYSTHPEFGRELIHYQIWYAALTGRDIYVERRMTPLFEELRSERRRQQSVAGLLSYLSPSMILKVTLDDIAGTGPERHQRFLTQFGDYLRSREAWFTKRVAAARDISSKDLSNFALFRFDEEPASVVAARVSLPVAALWILAAALLYVGLRRCESATI